MALRIALVVIVVTVISYHHVRRGLEGQALEQLREYVAQRGVREGTLFVLAQDNLAAFAEDYHARLAALGETDPVERFTALFAPRPDGSLALTEALYRDRGITGRIGPYARQDADLRRRLVVAFDLLAQYGPAWANRFTNLYLILPENAVLMYWPGKPWGLEASDWEISARLALAIPTDRVLVLDDRAPPPPGSHWSPLYFDYAANDWLVSVTTPVARQDHHLASVGLDLPLQALIDRALEHHLEGTYNLILRDDGRLVVHPRFMEAIQASSGELTVAAVGDPELERIYQAVRQRPEGPVILDDATDGVYLAATRLAGPGWHFVTVFPKELIGRRAFETARLILVLGGMALVAEVILLLLVLRRQVAAPLGRLMGAVDRVAAGDYRLTPDESRSDEIGQLGRAFTAMARELEAREAALNERSRSLSRLNEQLAQELEERQRAEAEVIRQREALHQSEKLNALGSLLAGVAHELNNPLSVVVGRALLLEEKLGKGPHGAEVEKIRSAAERCARIVRTFLAMARQQRPARRQVALEEVLDGALDLVGYGLKADGVEVVVDLDGPLPPLMADPDQLSQVVVNLLVNAQQAMAGEDGPRRIVITARHEPGRVVVRVADSGPGIPQEVARRVFDPFFTTKEMGQGTGVGLSVSHGIVQAHGGSLTTLAPGPDDPGGAVFELSLPVEAGEGEPHQPEPDASDRRRLLVVDDEEEVAQMLAELLAGEHLETRIAHNGRQALERLAAERFDGVLSDLRMPDLDGEELFREIQSRWPDLARRVVFITGDTLSDVTRQFLKEAGRPVIDKPFVPDEVRRVVEELLGGKQGGS